MVDVKKYAVDDLPVEVFMAKSKAAENEDFYNILYAVGVFLLVVGGLLVLADLIKNGSLFGNPVAHLMIMFGIPASGLAMHKKLAIQFEKTAIFESELDRLLSFSRNELPDGKELAFDLVQIRQTDDIYRIRLIDSADSNT